MSTLTHRAERIAAAGCSRAVPSSVGAPAAYAGAGVFAAAAAFGGWGSNPTIGMPVQVETAKKRHDLTPAPRPEEALP